MDLWSSLKPQLSNPILETISNFGHERMTPVQSATIPLFLSQKDVAVEAVTGSGKTLSFVIPLFEMLLHRTEPLRKHDIGALIITPTRELAMQIHSVLSSFIVNCPHFTHLLLIGGTDPKLEQEKFSKDGGHVLVGTPGRLEDFMKKKELAASLKALEVLVLDEADRLLHMGFKDSLDSIFSYLPKQRRTGLFSATQTDELEDLIRAGLRNPVRVVVKEKKPQGVATSLLEQKTPYSLDNYYFLCDLDKKLDHLVAFLRRNTDQKVLLFFSTCACVDYFACLFRKLLSGVQILAIHGKKSNRSKVFEKFSQLDKGLLLCTDVMGRGVDIPLVHWVIQYDPPVSASNFVHRCGRTARIGNKGSAMVFLQPHEDAYVEFLKINQKAPLKALVLKEKADVLGQVKKCAMQDRDLYEKGLKAFVSFVQSYAKHECHLIFKIKDLNFGKLATGFGLLHLPRMPELKDKQVTDFEKVNFDFSSISYNDKHREKQRLVKLEEFLKTKNERKFKVKKEAWSKKKEQKEKRALRKEGKMKKKQRMQEDKEKVRNEEEDEKEMAKDIRLMKKLKSGKISKEDFDKKFI